MARLICSAMSGPGVMASTKRRQRKGEDDGQVGDEGRAWRPHCDVRADNCTRAALE